MPRRPLSAALWLALVVWAGGILWLSSQTPENLPSAAFLTWDKLNHFIAFAVGAFVPLLPFILLTGFTALSVRIALTAVALFSVGAAVSLLTGKSAIYTGLRQLAIGAAAAAITYAVGSLIGVNV